MVDEEVIESYFYLNKRITKTRKRMAQRERNYREINRYPSNYIEDEDIRRVAFRIEPEVINHVSAQQDAERHITIMKFKLKHFNRFLKGISREERSYYFYKHKEKRPSLNDKLDHLLEEEIAEIEEAVGYRFNLELSLQTKLENSSIENHFEEMADLLGV